MCVCGKPWIKGYKQGVNSPFSYVAPWSYGRCGGRGHGRMNLYPLSVWDPAKWRSGLPFIISRHAFSKVGEQGQVAEVHRHLVFHRNGQHDNITSHNMTCFHVISFHPLPSGCIQVCLSCTRIFDKVPGKLREAWWCVHRRYQITFKICQTSCCQKQTSHKHPDVVYQNSPAEGEFSQNSPRSACSELDRITDFSFQNSRCHP